MRGKVELRPVGAAVAASIVFHAALLVALFVISRPPLGHAPQNLGYIYVTLGPSGGSGNTAQPAQGHAVAAPAPHKLAHFHRLIKKLVSKFANKTKPSSSATAASEPSSPRAMNLSVSTLETGATTEGSGLSGQQAASSGASGSGDNPLPGEQVDEPPVVVSAVVPDYPEAARRGHVEGEVVLQFVVDRQGKVESSIKVVESVPMLDQAAIDALRKWRFSPGRDHGIAVRVLLEVPLRFTLRAGG